LIEERYAAFNGRATWLANHAKSKTAIVGVEIDSEMPASFFPLLHQDRFVGCTLTSVRSPFLRRAIALAQVEKQLTAPGTEFTLTLPMSLKSQKHRMVAARVVRLPFVDAL
jgi:glycine cleavage system aminomethyltransferase T